MVNEVLEFFCLLAVGGGVLAALVIPLFSRIRALEKQAREQQFETDSLLRRLEELGAKPETAEAVDSKEGIPPVLDPLPKSRGEAVLEHKPGPEIPSSSAPWPPK